MYKYSLLVLSLLALCVHAQSETPDNVAQGDDGDQRLEQSILSGDTERIAKDVAAVDDEIDARIANCSDGVEEVDETVENKIDFFKLFSGLYYQRTYLGINQELIKRVPTNTNAAANMKAALEWLDEETKNGTPVLRKSLVEALRQFNALERLKGDEKCTKNAYAILVKNDRATNGRAHGHFEKLGALRRIENVVYQYSVEHAISCYHVYPQLFETKRAQMDQVQLQRVEKFLEDLINKSLRLSRSFFFFPSIKNVVTPSYQLIREITSISGKASGFVAYDMLKRFAKNDKDRIYLARVVDEQTTKVIINREKVAQLFKKYLVEPCEYYMSELGPEVFIPARYNAIMLAKEDRYNPDEYPEFVDGTVYFRLCKHLITHDQDSLLNDVITVIDEQSV